MEITDGGITDLAEIMRQDLRRKANGDTLGALCQQQRELHRQGDRLLVAAVVRHFPVGGLRIEHRVEGELRESGLDIAGGSGTGACEDITPVALGVDQQVLLAHLHEGVADTGIAVGVELHRVSHNVRHLVEASVVHPLHRVEDASLHGFQTVAQVGHGTLEDHVGGVIQEPVLIHATEVVYGCRVEAVHGFIVGMAFFLVFRRLLF